MFNKHIVVFFNLKVFNSRDILKCFGGINPQVTSIKSTLIIFAYFILKAFNLRGPCESEVPLMKGHFMITFTIQLQTLKTFF